MVELRKVKSTILLRLRLVTQSCPTDGVHLSQPIIPEYLALLPTNSECTSIRWVSGLTYPLRTHRSTYVPMIRFWKHWCRRVTKVRYQEIE